MAATVPKHSLDAQRQAVLALVGSSTPAAQPDVQSAAEQALSQLQPSSSERLAGHRAATELAHPVQVQVPSPPKRSLDSPSA